MSHSIGPSGGVDHPHPFDPRRDFPGSGPVRDNQNEREVEDLQEFQG
ncbi:MAG: hypothetical protein JSS32_00185 [Verrucomicrobia bacterium]|nr:hypothetical protein [Verrucomicrobiota bacterium]